MIADRPLYDAMSEGLQASEADMIELGMKNWKVLMAAWDPKNPNAYMVIGSPGEEEMQGMVAKLISPHGAIDATFVETAKTALPVKEGGA